MADVDRVQQMIIRPAHQVRQNERGNLHDSRARCVTFMMGRPGPGRQPLTRLNVSPNSSVTRENVSRPSISSSERSSFQLT